MLLRAATRRVATPVRALAPASSIISCRRAFSTSPALDGDDEGALSPFAPTAEHKALREMVASFTASEVEPQALVYNREEKFNAELFRRAGELGLLGVTVDPDYGGSGMDATAACIVHEELSASDPAFCLSYLAHSQLFVNNLARNGSAEQKARHDLSVTFPCPVLTRPSPPAARAAHYLSTPFPLHAVSGGLSL